MFFELRAHPFLTGAHPLLGEGEKTERKPEG